MALELKNALNEYYENIQSVNQSFAYIRTEKNKINLKLTERISSVEKRKLEKDMEILSEKASNIMKEHSKYKMLMNQTMVLMDLSIKERIRDLDQDSDLVLNVYEFDDFFWHIFIPAQNDATMPSEMSDYLDALDGKLDSNPEYGDNVRNIIKKYVLQLDDISFYTAQMLFEIDRM